MSITFETYSASPAQGQMVMPLGVRALEVAGNTGAVAMPFDAHGEFGTTVSPPAHGHMALALGVFATDVEGAVGHVVLPFDAGGSSSTMAAPELAIGSMALPLDASGHGHTISAPAQGDMALPLVVFGSEGGTFGHITMPLGVLAREDGTTRRANLYQFPWLEADGYSGITLGLTDSFHVADVREADFIQALVDLMTFDARYSVSAAVLAALRDGLSLHDIASMFLQADLVDSWIASEVLAGTAQITVLLTDGFVADDAADSLATILAALRDGFYATLTIATGADEYTAWVMTPQTKAMRRYTDFPFNSFAVMNGQLLAAGAAGIYRMGGDKDAGAAIRAAIRTGMLDFGSMAMKSAPLVYIGATTAGDLLLRVQATTVRGAEVQQTYRMVPAKTGAPREHRVTVGKGFRSVYWTFELANDTDGAAFEVHEWHAVPVQHTGKLI